MHESKGSGTIEAKYTFATGIGSVLEPALDAVCVRDLHYPDDGVNSVYFDTRDRAHLAEKVNSDYLKAKVRLRWYGVPGDAKADQTVQAFLEVKTKQGVCRRKLREPVEIPGDSLIFGKENFGELEQVANLAGGCGYVARGPLFPMIAIRYRRLRFVEPVTSARISFDTHITYSKVNDQFFVQTSPRTLSMGVLEVKSSTGDLPLSFMAIRNFLNKRDSFSKYEECWQLYADPLYRREFQWMHFKR